MNTDLLARNEKLSRKTNSVTRDKARDQIIVVESVSQSLSTEQTREEIYYHFLPSNGELSENEAICKAKHDSTLMFLGLKESEECKPVVVQVEEKVELPVAPETSIAPALDVSDSEVKVKKRSAKKASKKKASKKTAAKKVEVEKEPEVEVQMDSEKEATVFMFDKKDRNHRALLSPILVNVLGDDWKASDENKSKVSSLLSSLNETVPCCDSEGNTLPEFIEKIDQLLKG